MRRLPAVYCYIDGYLYNIAHTLFSAVFAETVPFSLVSLFFFLLRIFLLCADGI